MALKVDIEKIVGPVSFENFKTGLELGIAEERNSTTYMGFQFKEVAERVVVKYSTLKLKSIHGCECT